MRDAYRSARKAAAKEKYDLIAWTLCIPQDLAGDAQKWWDKWSAEREQEDGVPMSLSNLSEFRTLLAKPDAADVRLEFFPQLPPVHQPQAPAVQSVPDAANLDELLFVAQLREAGLIEVDSAKEQFYNAELVDRDLADKGLATRLAAFAGLRADLRSVWEDRFNHHSAGSDDERLLPDLHPTSWTASIRPMTVRRASHSHSRACIARELSIRSSRAARPAGFGTSATSQRLIVASELAAAPRPDDLLHARLARLVLLLAEGPGQPYAKPWDVERLSTYDFLLGQPVAALGEEAPERRALVLARFDPRTFSYHSSSQRFTNRRRRIQHDLAHLLARGVVDASADANRVVYSLTPAGTRLAARFSSTYADSYRASARLVSRALNRLADKALRDRVAELLEAKSFVLDVYGETFVEAAR